MTLPRFENLRSHLNASINSPARYITRLLTLVDALHDDDPARFKSEHLPYIQGYAEHLKSLTYEVTSIEELVRIHARIPCLPLALTLSHVYTHGASLELELLDLPAMQAVRTLSLDHYLGGDAIAEKLLAQGACPGLQGLTLSHCALSDHTLTRFRDSPLSPQLQQLDLTMGDSYNTGVANTFSAKALAAFFQHTPFDHLRDLKLRCGAFEHRAFTQFFRHIMSSPRLPALHTLDLGGARRSSGTPPLPTTTSFTSRRTLGDISWGWLNLTDVDVIQLLDLNVFEGVKRLDLSWNDIKHKGFKALFKSPQLRQLTHLELAMVKVPKSAMKVLCQSPHMAHLKTLTMTVRHKIDEDTTLHLKQLKGRGCQVNISR